MKRAESPPPHVSEDSSSSESEASDSESHSSAESDASDDEAPRQVTSRQPVTSTPPVAPPVSKSVKLDDDEVRYRKANQIKVFESAINISEMLLSPVKTRGYRVELVRPSVRLSRLI